MSIKKNLLCVGVLAMLISSNVSAQKVVKLNDDNSYNIGAKITSIREKRDTIKIKLKTIDGRRFYVNLSIDEFVDWCDEEGVVRKNNKVMLTIYNNDTPDNFKDDKVVHITKRSE